MICQLNSTANLAQFGWKLAGLAVLFSRQILNDSQDFFSHLLNNFRLIFQILNETHACALFMVIFFYIAILNRNCWWGWCQSIYPENPIILIHNLSLQVFRTKRSPIFVVINHAARSSTTQLTCKHRLTCNPFDFSSGIQ